LIKSTVLSISSKKALVRRLKKLCKSIDKSRDERLIGYFEWQDFEFVKSLFIEELQNGLTKQNVYFFKLLNDVKHVEDDLNKLLYLEIYTFLIDHNLNYTDKAGMANSVEIRVPYLDLDLVNFSATIPVKYKMRGRETKFILKKVAERYLPTEVIYRSKSGFGAPVEHWVRQELVEYIDNKLQKKNLNRSGLYKYHRVKEITEKNKAGQINASYSVWSLLAIQSWFEQYVNEID
jgi:asparagine synthase (glutamine-hydrolysing)